MGIRSWLRSLRSEDPPGDEPNSFIKYRYEDPAFEHLDHAPFARDFDLPRAAGQ